MRITWKYKCLLTIILLALPLLGLSQTEQVGMVSADVTATTLGGAAIEIPLAVAPGTNATTPKLSLSYNSTDDSGLLGLGWGISGLSSITRCGTTVDDNNRLDPIDVDANDKLCLDGNVFVAVSGTYGAANVEYRTENESFARITTSGTHGNGPLFFKVQTKAGLIQEFGGSAAISNSNHVPGALAWHLSKIEDPHGNQVLYEYQINSGTSEVLISKIKYTLNSNNATTAYNEIIFSYDETITPNPYLLRGVAGTVLINSKQLGKIAVFVEGILAWEYRMTYDLDPVSKHGRLRSVTQCDANGACLRPTTFNYGAASTEDLQFTRATSQNILFGSAFAGHNNFESAMVGDWNGDGLTDAARVGKAGEAYFYKSRKQVDAELPQTVNFDTYAIINPMFPYPGNNNAIVGASLTGDWNGDGKTDVAAVTNSGVKFYYSTGSGFVISSQLSWNGYESPTRHPVLVGDWNGDGRSDIARVTESQVVTYISVGEYFISGWQLSDLSPAQNYTGLITAPMIVGDWNGDGLTDIARVTFNGVKFYTSNGREFVEWWYFYQFGNTSGYTDDLQYPLLTGDWNADGLTDIGRVTNQGVKLCHSSGQYIGDCFDLPHFGYNASSAPNRITAPIITADFNSDGTTDIMRIHPQDGASMFYLKGKHYFGPVNHNIPWNGTSFADSITFPIYVGDWNGDGFNDLARSSSFAFTAYYHKPSQTQLITEVIDGLNNITKITYTDLTDTNVYTPGTASSYPEVYLTPTRKVVSQISSSNGLGSENLTKYRYHQFKYHYGTGPLGFQKIEKHNLTTGLIEATTYSHSTNTGGLPILQEIIVADSGIKISKKDTTWVSRELLPGKSKFVFASQIREEKRELNNELYATITETRQYDDWGNLTVSETTYSDGSKNKTTSSYSNDANTWRLGLLTSATQENQASNSNIVNTRKINYFYLPNSNLIEREVIAPDSPKLNITKSYSYNSHGNISTITKTAPDEKPRTETREYDPNGRYVVKSKNALEQISTSSFDPRFGKPTIVTSINNQKNTWEYDFLGRHTKYTLNDNSSVTIQYLWPDANAPANAAYQVVSKRGSLPATTSYFDSLNREIRNVVIGFSGAQIIIDKVYDESGNLILESEPYFSNKTPLWTAREYDRQSRVTTMTEPNGAVTLFHYQGLSSTTVNALNQTRTTTYDLAGNLVKTIDHYGNQANYEYDGFKQLTKITDPAGQQTHIEYDILGNKTKIIEPNSGATLTSYNGFGEVLSETNANGQTINYAYDALGRIITTSSNDGTFNWTYDQSKNGIGEISTVKGNNFQSSYTYDAYSRLVSTTTVTLGKQYVVKQTYDGLSRPIRTTYPSGLIVQRYYNQFGFLHQINNINNGKMIWKAITQDARGQLTQMRYGNNLITNSQFDTATGLLKNRTITNRQNLSFSYDALGNLKERRDLLNSLSETFEYDELNRLTKTKVPGQPEITVTYDAVGNITSRSDVGTYHYGQNGAGPQAVTAITGNNNITYQYDSAGRRISSSRGTVQYTTRGLPKRIQENWGKLETTVFSPDGQPVVEETWTGTTLTEKKVRIGSLYEELTSSSNSSIKKINYIQAQGDEVVAAYITQTNTTPVTIFFHKDHLGSIQTITNDSGNIVETLSFDAWGQRRNAKTWTSLNSPTTGFVDRGFTGHRHIDRANLIHMQGRVYDPFIGRFLSPDIYVQTLANGQNLNRYSYVLNNPLSYTDPSGFFFKKLFKFIKKFLPQIVGIAVGAFVAPHVLFLGPGISSAVTGFVSSFASNVIAGGGIANAFKMSLKNVPMYALRGIVSYHTGSISLELSKVLNVSEKVTNVVAHGISGGVLETVQGGKFTDGLLTQAASAIGAGQDSIYLTLISGATVSALRGGKWYEGAMNSLTVYFFNHQAHKYNQERYALQISNAWCSAKVGNCPTGGAAVLSNSILKLVNESEDFRKLVAGDIRNLTDKMSLVTAAFGSYTGIVGSPVFVAATTMIATMELIALGIDPNMNSAFSFAKSQYIANMVAALRHGETATAILQSSTEIKYRLMEWTYNLSIDHIKDNQQKDQ